MAAGHRRAPCGRLGPGGHLPLIPPVTRCQGVVPLGRLHALRMLRALGMLETLRMLHALRGHALRMLYALQARRGVHAMRGLLGVLGRLLTTGLAVW